MRIRPLALVLAALGAVACGDEPGARSPGVPPAAETASPVSGAAPPPRRRRAVTCAGLAPPCTAVRGRVVYVERVDPDGDGDAHYVLATRRSISLPGLTAVDVRPDLRPRRLPRAGEWVSAAGPVQTGSYGQPQIHALRVRHHRGVRPRG